MIILDTNLVSEPFKDRPNPAVRDWLDAQVQDQLFLKTITAAELLAGAAQLPAGRRRSGLESRILGVLDDFGDRRILAFDLPASRTYADIRGRMRAAGVGISALDAQIAAIAASRGFAVATRDVGPFVAAGIAVIDPWNGAPG